MDATARFADFLTRDAFSAAQLFEYFDALPAVEIPFLIGEWRGGLLPTGHRGEGQLDNLRWDGKTFRGRDDVDPIVSRSQTGAREVNPIMGAASLRMVQYRGVVTATMVYDKHPIFDHFRRIDGNTVIGVMESKGDTQPLFFYLQRLA